MATQIINREELKQKVMKRASEIIDKYSYSAERGIEELEKCSIIGEKVLNF